jgi:hypothetical protein
MRRIIQGKGLRTRRGGVARRRAFESLRPRCPFFTRLGFEHCGLATLAVLILAVPGRAVAASTLITFDDQPVGAIITDQYPGVHFLNSGRVIEPSAGAHSPTKALSNKVDPSEEFNPEPMRIEFDDPEAHVKLYAGLEERSLTPIAARLSAFDASGNLVGEDTASVGPGHSPVSVPLEVDVSTPSIKTVALSYFDSFVELIDDLEFSTSAVGAANFTLSATTPEIEVKRGNTTTDVIAINRFNGSSGAIGFSLSGIPAGISASISPNPTDGAAATLTVSASAQAPLVVGVPITLTATPLVPSAGQAVRTIDVPVFVRLPDGLPEFDAVAALLAHNQEIDLGHAASPDTTDSQLVHFQQFWATGSPFLNSIEMHRDGTIYVAYTPPRSPFWYTPYRAHDLAADNRFLIRPGVRVPVKPVQTVDVGEFDAGSGEFVGMESTTITAEHTTRHIVPVAAVNSPQTDLSFHIVNRDNRTVTVTANGTTRTLAPNAAGDLLTVPVGTARFVGWSLRAGSRHHSDALEIRHFVVDYDTRGLAYFFGQHVNVNPDRWVASTNTDPPNDAFPPGRGPAPHWFELSLPRGITPAQWLSYLHTAPESALRMLVPGPTTHLQHSGSYCYHDNSKDGNVLRGILGTAIGVLFDIADVFQTQVLTGPPEWQTILPSPGYPGEKRLAGTPLTWPELFTLEQRDPNTAQQVLRWSGHPDAADHRSRSYIPWISSAADGIVTNSFLSGADGGASHGEGPRRGYWPGVAPPLWSGACDDSPIAENTHQDCADAVVFVRPDPEYRFLLAADEDWNRAHPGKGLGNGDDEHSGDPQHRTDLGNLEDEEEQWLVPIGYWPEPGDRIHLVGRWIVDCGHEDWHGELHPYEVYVTSHLQANSPIASPMAGQPAEARHGDVAVDKVVTTGAWRGGSVLLDLWPPPRPSADAHLTWTRQIDRLQGVTINEVPQPADDPNHLQVTLTKPYQELSGLGRRCIFEALFINIGCVTGGFFGGLRYDQQNRLAATYKLSWRESH